MMEGRSLRLISYLRTVLLWGGRLPHHIHNVHQMLFGISFIHRLLIESGGEHPAAAFYCGI